MLCKSSVCDIVEKYISNFRMSILNKLINRKPMTGKGD